MVITKCICGCKLHPWLQITVRYRYAGLVAYLSGGDGGVLGLPIVQGSYANCISGSKLLYFKQFVIAMLGWWPTSQEATGVYWGCLFSGELNKLPTFRSSVTSVAYVVGVTLTNCKISYIL